MAENVDVVVIGAGQAGLAAGYYLKQTNLSFVLLDSSARIGNSWRSRYDSLVLFNPRSFCALPDLNLTGDPNGSPTKDEFADYLESYAAHFSLPVRLQTCVKKIKKLADKFQVTTAEGKWIAGKVIVATGPFQKPVIPKIRYELPKDVLQLHSSEYKRPSQLQEGPVLVVGGGNSGSQLAVELADKREVIISTGHRMFFLPQMIGGRSFVWWLEALRFSNVSVNSKLAKYIQIAEPVIGFQLKKLIKTGHVLLKKRTMGFDGKHAIFQDGTSVAVNNVIWATGYTQDYSWIDIQKAVNQRSEPIHQKGISQAAGLYFLGLPWLSAMNSSQINGISKDAKRIVKYIKEEF